MAAVRGSLQLLAEMPGSGSHSLAIVLVLRPSRSHEPGSSVPVAPLLRGRPADLWLAWRDELPVLQCRSRLLLWDGDEQCDWSIQPASAELAAAALDEIEEIAGIADKLYGLEDQHEQALRQWRAIAGKA
jgi:hypothetical protein